MLSSRVCSVLDGRERGGMEVNVIGEAWVAVEVILVVGV